MPEISPEVEQVVLAALSKDSKDRFGSVQAFATALAQAAQVPIKQDVPPMMSKEVSSTDKHSWSKVVDIASEAEHQHDRSPDLTSPHTDGDFPSPSTAENVSESASDAFSATSERVLSFTRPSSPLPYRSPGLLAETIVPAVRPNLSRLASQGRGSILRLRALVAGVLVFLVLAGVIGFTLHQHGNVPSTVDTQPTLLIAHMEASATAQAQASATAANARFVATKRWVFQRGSVNPSPTVANGVVYVGSSDDNVYAIQFPSS